jgi:hypothetical protein
MVIVNSPFLNADQSIPVRADYSVQLCTGTLGHVLESARKRRAIINALSFPLPLSEIRKTSFSSDVEAWRLTEGLPHCDRDATFPTADMRWGLGATAGARSWIHIDCDGLATIINVVSGARAWMVYTPDDPPSDSNFGEIDLFIDDFDVTRPPRDWRVEMVYLQPGTCL